jgi:hypothetical protein
MSANMGSGKSSSRGGTDPTAAHIATLLSAQYAKEVEPLRQDFISQLQTALTGDTDAAVRLPVIASAMEASRRAGSQAMQQTDEELARTGLAGTPFGVRTKSETGAQNAYNTSQIVPQFFAMLTQLIPDFVSGQSQAALQALPAIQYSKGDQYKWEAGGGKK